MSNQEETFEDAIKALLTNANEQEEAINKDTEINEDEKTIFRVLLQGYRKALNDILELSAEINADEEL